LVGIYQYGPRRKAEVGMTQAELLKKLETILNDAGRTKMYGTFEIEVREGAPILIRTIKTEKIQCTGNGTHADKYR
jgi:hypothetical protein